MASLKDCLSAAYNFLIPYVEELNDMNVFPIADKDTGSNLCRTFKFVLDEKITSADIKEQLILQARGSSGNIFTLFFREWPEEIKNVDALQKALDTAKEKIPSYLNLIEGTAWTAMKSYPREALEIQSFFTQWLKNIEDCILEGPKILSILEDYNTLDSGAVGFYYMLCGIAKELGIKYSAKHFFVKRKQGFYNTDAQRYCTEAIITSRVSEEAYLPALVTLGDSLIHYKDKNTIKLHIHTNNPEKVKLLCESLGKIKDWKVEDML